MERIEINRMEGLSAYRLAHIVSDLEFIKPNLRGQQRPETAKKAVLRALCDRYPNVWPGLKDIAKKASCSVAQARRMLRELEYKDRLIVDVNSRMEWRWPCACEDKRTCGHRANLVPVSLSKQGGYAKSSTVQYVINDRRILDIYELQKYWEGWDNAHSSEDADAHSSQAENGDEEGCKKAAMPTQPRNHAHSAENQKQPMPTQPECQTYNSLTNHSLTGQGAVRGKAAQIAALSEATATPLESAAGAAEVKTPESMPFSALSHHEKKKFYEQGLMKAQAEGSQFLFRLYHEEYRNLMDHIGETPMYFKAPQAA